MSIGQIAFLALVLVGYAVFIAVLGAHWLQSTFDRQPAQARGGDSTRAKPTERQAA